jgi:hypothetical protein
MCMRYSARIIENGKARHADCSGYTPGDALLRLVQLKHIRKGATVHLGSAMWVGDTYVSGTTTYRHMPERDTERYSTWELVGSDLVQYLTAKPE